MSRDRWTARKENRNTDHSNEEQIASGCCVHRGLLPHGGVGFAATSTLGQRRHRHRFFQSCGQFGGLRRRRGPMCSIGRPGISIPMTPARRSGSFAQRRGTGTSHRPVGHRRGVGLFDAPAHRVAALVVFPRRNTGSSMPGLLRATVVRVHAKERVKRPFAENGWRIPRARCRASPLPGVTARRFGGCSRAAAVSNMARGLALIRPAGPTRKWSRRA